MPIIPPEGIDEGLLADEVKDPPPPRRPGKMFLVPPGLAGDKLEMELEAALGRKGKVTLTSQGLNIQGLDDVSDADIRSVVLAHRGGLTSAQARDFEAREALRRDIPRLEREPGTQPMTLQELSTTVGHLARLVTGELE